MKVAVFYTTRDGQTRKIIDEIVQVWQAKRRNLQVDIIQLQKGIDIRLSDYQFVLLGTSIRYGKYSPIARAFMANQAAALNQMNSAFFGVNLIARKPEKQTPETNSYTRKLLEWSPWKPRHSAVFAGALLYPRYGFFDRIMIQLIMRLTGGETDSTKEVEYTDWEQVRRFAQETLTSFD